MHQRYHFLCKIGRTVTHSATTWRPVRMYRAATTTHWRALLKTAGLFDKTVHMRWRDQVDDAGGISRRTDHLTHNLILLTRFPKIRRSVDPGIHHLTRTDTFDAPPKIRGVDPVSGIHSVRSQPPTEQDVTNRRRAHLLPRARCACTHAAAKPGRAGAHARIGRANVPGCARGQRRRGAALRVKNMTCSA